MQAKPQARANIVLFSEGLSPEQRLLTGVTLTDSIEQAVADSLARHGDPHVAVIPEGPYVVPVAP